MSEIDDSGELPDWLRLTDDLTSVLGVLSGTEEDALRRILRPHDDADVGSLNNVMVELRSRLDKALDALTRLEIARELGLYGLKDSVLEAYLTRRVPKWPMLVHSDSFLRYLGAYLYFGVRIFAGRISPPVSWNKPGKSQPDDSPNNGPFVNKRLLQLATPPTMGGPKKNLDALTRFQNMRAVTDTSCSETLRFLDGFHTYRKSEGLSDYNYNEPADFELWLRGLRPDAIQGRADGFHQPERFEKIKDGIKEWSGGRADFYMSLEPTPEGEEAGTTWREWRRPSKGWTVSDPVMARIALSDFYWLARLLRAEVTAGGRVSYPRSSWLHVLNFEAKLHKDDNTASKLLDEEEVLRSVFDYVCDLVLNAVELSEERVRRSRQPLEFPAPQDQVKQWRTVFDEELREVQRQKDRRAYLEEQDGLQAETVLNQLVDEGGDIKGGGGSRKDVRPVEKAIGDEGEDKSGWSRRLWNERDTRPLVGLAFSGGGIRSATFNLGVLQGLQELDLLRHVDYLSTVSGGGFIGAWLLGNVRRARHWLGRRTCWDESVEHLRSYSNYLAPLTGVFSADTWTMGLSWVRNAFLVQVSALAWVFFLLSGTLLLLRGFLFAAKGPASLLYLGLSAMTVAAIVTVCLAYNFTNNRAETGKDAPGDFWVLASMVAPAWIAAILLTAILARECGLAVMVPAAFTTEDAYSKILKTCFKVFPWIFGLQGVGMWIVGWFALAPESPKPVAFTNAETWIRLLRSLLTSAVCLVVSYLEICGVIYLFTRLADHAASYGSYAFMFGPSLVLLSFTVSVVVWIGLSGKVTNDAQREWWTRFGAWLLMVGVATLLLAAVTLLGPALMVWVFDGWHGLPFKTVKWASIVSWIGTVVGGLFAGNSSKTGDATSTKSAPLAFLAKLGGFLFIVGVAVAAATTLYLFLMVYNDRSLHDCYWLVLNSVHQGLLWCVLGAMFVCGMVFSWYFDINIFGLSRFYQYRLVRCYLGATRWMPGVRNPHPFTGFDHNDDLWLSDLKLQETKEENAGEGYAGPYPVLNCTLNLAGSSDLALNTRHSASFSLTPMYCGSDRPKVGYVATGDFRHPEQSFAGGVKLGQAAAVSGAAASPNMGYNTSPLVAFLLTMFNVRLGWWFPNPGERNWSSQGLGWSLYYLVCELLGIADETRNYLNISDGGHFENLAIYELVRRRCKVIIASDAECDELLQFGGLGNVLRICGTDFGAEIELDIKSIRAQKNGHSLAHAAVGKINYDNGSIGYLIYLKASTTGDEDVSIAQYRATHPSFPHESTADQFFTEDQFESYRKLGMHAVKHSFRGTQVGQQPFEVAERMFDMLAPAGCPSEVFLRHSQTLERIWGQFRVSPGLDLFLRELMLGPVPPPTAAIVLNEEEVCMGLELIELMEEVFLDMQLDDFWEHPDNRGWAIMFMRWARSPRFQQAWTDTRRTYGIRFEYFCAGRLGLTRDNPIVRV